MIRQLVILIITLLVLNGCSSQGYPSALKEYLKVNRYPVGSNILVARYLHYIHEGVSEKEALRRARTDYVNMVRYLETHHPDHLYNMEVPKIKKL